MRAAHSFFSAAFVLVCVVVVATTTTTQVSAKSIADGYNITSWPWVYATGVTQVSGSGIGPYWNFNNYTHTLPQNESQCHPEMTIDDAVPGFESRGGYLSNTMAPGQLSGILLLWNFTNFENLSKPIDDGYWDYWGSRVFIQTWASQPDSVRFQIAYYATDTINGFGWGGSSDPRWPQGWWFNYTDNSDEFFNFFAYTDASKDPSFHLVLRAYVIPTASGPVDVRVGCASWQVSWYEVPPPPEMTPPPVASPPAASSPPVENPVPVPVPVPLPLPIPVPVPVVEEPSDATSSSSSGPFLSNGDSVSSSSSFSISSSSLYFNSVTTLSPIAPQQSAPTPPPQQTQLHSNGMSPAGTVALAGGSAAAVLFVTAIAVVVLILRRRRRDRTHDLERHNTTDTVTVSVVFGETTFQDDDDEDDDDSGSSSALMHERARTYDKLPGLRPPIEYEKMGAAPLPANMKK